VAHDDRLRRRPRRLHGRARAAPRDLTHATDEQPASRATSAWEVPPEKRAENAPPRGADGFLHPFAQGTNILGLIEGTETPRRSWCSALSRLIALEDLEIWLNRQRRDPAGVETWGHSMMMARAEEDHAMAADGSMADRVRVIQWTTGRTGAAAVQGIVGHPRIELVGCYAYSPEKVGRDVGELCRLEPLGITATDDVASLVALQPDCVVYTAFRPDFDHLERILEAGINVVTTLHMLSGRGYGDEPTRRIRAAMARGGSSLYSSGIYPGHAPMVALAVSGMCRRIDRLSVLESLDIQEYANEQMFRAQGFDREPDDPEVPVLVEASCGSFKDQVRSLAHALAVTVDRVEFQAEVATADDDVDFGFMTLRKGRVAGILGSVAAVHAGRSVIECRFVWKLGEKMTPNWPVTNGYLIEIEGDPGVRCTLQPLEGHFPGAVTTAMPVVNAIPAVCAAPPGIVNRMELPFVRGAHRIR
jgi:2,4-diaminopentanoate dehydrogenase